MDWVVETGMLAALGAAAITWVALKLLHPLAPRLHLLDYPKGRKDHAHPTPITGGLAMAAAFVVIGVLTVDSFATDTLVSFSVSTLR